MDYGIVARISSIVWCYTFLCRITFAYCIRYACGLCEIARRQFARSQTHRWCMSDQPCHARLQARCADTHNLYTYYAVHLYTFRFDLFLSGEIKRYCGMVNVTIIINNTYNRNFRFSTIIQLWFCHSLTRLVITLQIYTYIYVQHQSIHQCFELLNSV